MKRHMLTHWNCLATAALLLAATVTARGDDPAPAPESSAEETVTVVVQPTEGDPAAAAAVAGQGVVVVQENEAPDQAETATITFDVEGAKPGQYWLGIMCMPLDNDMLKTHLGIEHGIVVQEVVDDSPAAKAGLQAHDILIQAGDQSLTDLKVLVETTEKTEGKPLALTFIRKGERQTVEVTPVQRPAESAALFVPDKEAADEWKLLQDSLRMHWAPQMMQQGATAADGTRMLFVMPGFVLPDQAKDFPKDLEVTILKKGEEPAKITVKRGDQQWEVDGKSLDKLPEDIRPHVQQMLGGGLSVTFGDGNFSWSSDARQSLALPHLAPAEALKKSFKITPKLRTEIRDVTGKLPAEVRARIDAELKEAQKKVEDARSSIPTETLDKIQQELKELREQIEKLRTERAAQAQPDAAAPDADADKQPDPGT